MLRARRLVSVAAVAALGLSMLTGCRSDPAVAAYVDGEPISRDRVDAIYQDARTKLDKAVEAYRAGQPQDPAAGTPEPVEMPITRQEVVTILVAERVLRGLAEEKGVSPVSVDPAKLEQDIQLPRDADYAKTYANFQGLFLALVKEVEPRALTNADLHDVHDRVRRGGGVSGLEGNFTEFSAKLGEEGRNALSNAMAIRDLFYRQVEEANVVVNPRYAPVELPLVQVNGLNGKPVKLVVLSFTVEEAVPPIADAA